MVTNVCAQGRAELQAAEMVPMSKERGLDYVWRGLILRTPGMSGCTFCNQLLQVISFGVHLREGKENTQEINHGLPPSNINRAPTAIPKRYPDFKRANKTKNLTPSLLFWLSTCLKVTVSYGVFLVRFPFFHCSSPPLPPRYNLI